MRIHTNLSYGQMRDVARASGAPIYLEVLEEHGSHTHPRAFEVALSGSGGRAAWGNGDFQAATWDEWGAFFGSLYDADPTARCGGSKKRPVYRDADHYHFVTGDRFHAVTNTTARNLQMDVDSGEITGEVTSRRTSYLPADTHPRHRWEYRHGEGFACSKCSATRPSWQQVDAYAPRTYTTN